MNKSECKFKVDDYVETRWPQHIFTTKGFRGQVGHIEWKKKKGWRITVDFSKTMPRSYDRITAVTFYQNDLRLVKSRTWLWFEIVVEQFKRWFNGKRKSA